jgi:hypothetical protein
MTRELMDRLLEIRIERLKRELFLLDSIAKEKVLEKFVRISPAKEPR